MSEPRMSLPIRIGSIDTTTSSFRQFLSEFPFDEAEKIIASLPADEQNKVLQDVLLRKFVATFKKHHVNRVFRNIKALIKECDEEDEGEPCAACHEGKRWEGADCCKECIERCCDGSGCDGCQNEDDE